MADVILVDTGARIANHALECVLASPEVLNGHNTGADITTDSYSLLKSLYWELKFDREYTKISVLFNRVISSGRQRSL